MEILDHRQHDLLQQRWRNMQPDRASGGDIVTDVIHHLLDSIERFGHFGQQGGSGWRKGQARSGAIKQLVAKQFLQPDNVPTDRALGNIQRLCTGRKAEVMPNSIEGPQGIQREPAAVDGTIAVDDRLLTIRRCSSTQAGA